MLDSVNPTLSGMRADPAAAIAAAPDGPGSGHSPPSTRSWTSDSGLSPSGTAGTLDVDGALGPLAWVLVTGVIGDGGDALPQAMISNGIAAQSAARHSFK